MQFGNTPANPANCIYFSTCWEEKLMQFGETLAESPNCIDLSPC
jgi:hypothetical protein